MVVAPVYVNAWWLAGPSLTMAVLFYALDPGRTARPKSANTEELGRLLAEALIVAGVFFFLAHYVVG